MRTRCAIVGKVENVLDFFAVGGQTNEFLQFKGDLFCLPCVKIVVLFVSDGVDHD